MTDTAVVQTNTLGEVVRDIYQRRKENLRKLASDAQKTGEEPEWLWEGLVRSAATWGSARGIKLMRDEELHKMVRWKVMENLDERLIEEQLRTALKKAGVRMYKRKSKYLTKNVALLKAMGGPVNAQQRIGLIHTIEEVIEFLSRFAGVGPKYARNLMMDGYQPMFRNSIAIDSRIQKILTKAGHPFDSHKGYADAEQFLLAVAKEAEIEGWMLDRLLFLYTNEVLTGLI